MFTEIATMTVHDIPVMGDISAKEGATTKKAFLKKEEDVTFKSSF